MRSKRTDLPPDHTAHDDPTIDTERWTSPSYHIQFETIEYVLAEPDDDETFDMSAWGISRGLRALLADYSDWQVAVSTRRITGYQSQVVANVLENMAMDAQSRGESIPPLEHLFIAIDGMLFMPDGLRVDVCCVTNIVPRGEPEDGLDKFVAILDPGEAQFYIDERTGANLPPDNGRVH